MCKYWFVLVVPVLGSMELPTAARQWLKRCRTSILMICTIVMMSN